MLKHNSGLIVLVGALKSSLTVEGIHDVAITSILKGPFPP